MMQHTTAEFGTRVTVTDAQRQAASTATFTRVRTHLWDVDTAAGVRVGRINRPDRDLAAGLMAYNATA